MKYKTIEKDMCRWLFFLFSTYSGSINEVNYMVYEKIFTEVNQLKILQCKMFDIKA